MVLRSFTSPRRLMETTDSVLCLACGSTSPLALGVRDRKAQTLNTEWTSLFRAQWSRLISTWKLKTVRIATLEEREVRLPCLQR